MKTLPATFLSVLLCPSLAWAGFAFESETVERVASPDSDSVLAEFSFTNRSNKSVTIARYDSACSCMGVKVVEGKMTYKPGETGVLQARFAVGNFSGTVDKTVVLWLEGDQPAKPSHTLTVRVKIPVLVEVEPKTLSWAFGADKEVKVIDIKMSEAHPAKVTKVAASSPEFRHELVTVEEGKHYQLKIEPMDTGVRGLAVFRIETDIDVARQRIQQAFAVVR